MKDLFYFAIAAAILIIISGVYSLLVSRNLIRILITIEVMMKAVTLLIITAGYLTNQLAVAQAMIITIIIIEVVVLVVAAGIVINIYKKNNTLDIRRIRNLKG